MKIVHVQLFEKIGGSERFIYQISEQQILRGLNVSVIFILSKNAYEQYKNFFSSFDNINCKVHLLSAEHNTKDRIALFFSLYNNIRKLKPDVLHLHLIQAEFFVGVLKMLFLIKAKTIVQKHGYNENSLVNYLNKRRISKLSPYWLISKLSFLVHSKTYTISKYFSFFFNDIGISNTPINYVYHGILSKPSISLVNSEKSINDHKYFCVVARLDAVKGHSILIDSINYLIQNSYSVDFNILFLGEGLERNFLVDKVKKLGLSKYIKFVGYVNNVDDYIKSSIAVVLPSRIEPFGLTILEAYQNGKCSISFDVPSLNEIIVNCETGYLIKPYSIDELAVKLFFLSNNEEEAKRLGNNAKNYVSNKFSTKNMVDQTLNIYNEVLG